MNIRSPIIVAADFPNESSAKQLIDALDPQLCRLKIGKELFTRLGPSIVNYAHAAGFDIFLDLKYHDIPNTVAGAVKACADLGVWMCNLHALGGQTMMEAAMHALEPYGKERPLLIAVTVLTSLSQADIDKIGFTTDTKTLATQLAKLSQQAGLDGVVCSALEADALKTACGDEFLRVTPGIRPASASRDDQQRVMTPPEAMANGASYLVIGRPITAADDPLAALQDIHTSLA